MHCYKCHQERQLVHFDVNFDLMVVCSVPTNRRYFHCCYCIYGEEEDVFNVEFILYEEQTLYSLMINAVSIILVLVWIWQWTLGIANLIFGYSARFFLLQNSQY